MRHVFKNASYVPAELYRMKNLTKSGQSIDIREAYRRYATQCVLITTPLNHQYPYFLGATTEAYRHGRDEFT